MPGDMPDRMPEDMSDRMPEDLPATECINVTVGITRIKVIVGFLFFWHLSFVASWQSTIVPTTSKTSMRTDKTK